MTTLRKYFCGRCGFSIRMGSDGKYALFSGEFRNAYCNECKKVVVVQLSDWKTRTDNPCCPICGNKHIKPWSPATCGCPNCNCFLTEATDEIILAD